MLRLLGRLRPERVLIIMIVVLTVFSVAATVASPKVMARATNLIFSGFISKQLPARGHPGAGGGKPARGG